MDEDETRQHLADIERIVQKLNDLADEIKVAGGTLSPDGMEEVAKLILLLEDTKQYLDRLSGELPDDP
jgi:hypothetical protein